MDPRLKQLFKRFGIVRRIVGARRARATAAFGDWWRELIADGLPHPQEGAPRVLLATSLGGWQPGTRLDSVLAAALRLRGAEVAFWLCDEALPACQMADAYFYPRQGRFLAQGPQADMCATCYAPARDLYAAFGVPVHRLSATLGAADLQEIDRLVSELSLGEIADLRIDGVHVGEHAMTGALRFYARGDLDSEKHGEAMLRQYLRAALMTLFSFQALLEKQQFDVVVLHHGIYVPQGTIAETARARGVRVVTWHPAYRRNCFTFSEDDTYHRAMLSEPTSAWEDMDWSPEHEAAIMDYLKSRWQGSEDWISFNRDPEENLQRISKRLGLDPGKPWIGLLTTVMWDARLHYPTNAFGDVREWVLATIEYFAERPDLQLVVRVHPAEVRGRLPARQLMTDEIERAFPELPGNVAVIPARSPISTYVVMANCDAALIYATKMGIELTASGIPTVVAGEAWIRGKGFSLDAGTPTDYAGILQRLPLGRRMDAVATERARKYAFHYFFRRMIPLEFVSQHSSESLAFDLQVEGLDDLAPGAAAGLDVICEGILSGAPFIYPADGKIGQRRFGIDEPEPHQAVL